LKSYLTKRAVLPKELTVNYRSVPRIVAAANCLAQRSDTANRREPSTDNGAYFVPYEKSDESKLIEAFQAVLLAAGLSLSNSAIVCRAAERKRELLNYGADYGQGTTKQFAAAAMARDSAADYQEAFRSTARAIVALLKAPPPNLCTRILDASRYPEFREISKVIWAFTRDVKTGLPAASLKAKSEWHPRLVRRVKVLLGDIQQRFGYAPVDNISQRLAKTKLLDEPMLHTKTTNSIVDRALRVETVQSSA
jgi:hypothetical protein